LPRQGKPPITQITPIYSPQALHAEPSSPCIAASAQSAQSAANNDVSLPRQGKPPIAELNAEGNAMRPFDKNAPVRSFFFASFVV